jgi:simple sugar transport system ATP-binding protein
VSEKRKVMELKNISKNFGSVRALQEVDLELYENETLALLGDNGAGKSTLIKIISGVHPPDSGKMWVNGQEVNFRTPEDAKNSGIETIYQDLALFDQLDPTQNIFVGREILQTGIGRFLGLVDKKKMFNQSRALLDRLSINIGDYRGEIKNFSGGQRQTIAIAKAIYWSQKIIIMDEPSAALGVRETEGLFKVIKDLQEHGVTFIMIMHNIDQVTQLAERAIVLRRGKRAGEVDIQQMGSEESRDTIVKMML